MSAGQASEDSPASCADCGGPHATGSILCEGQPLPEAPSLVGKVVGDKYQVIRRIGEGGMAAIFEAENRMIRKRVALKVLLSHLIYSEVAVGRFYREARTLASLGHENIVQVFDFGLTDERVPFMVMELLEGMDLADVLASRGRLEVRQAVWIVSQVLAGLDAAHHAGIVHRDLKPENVIVVGRRPGKEVVKLLDFGISLARGEEGSVRLTAQRTLVGTARYMAPEQITRPSEVDARADIHAAGALLYELCAGSPPFNCEDWRETLRQVTDAPPPPLSDLAPDVPDELSRVVHRALEKDPARRFQSAGQMLDALGPFLEWRNTDTILTWTIVPPGAGGGGGAETIETASPTSAIAAPDVVPDAKRAAASATLDRSVRSRPHVRIMVLGGAGAIVSVVALLAALTSSEAPAGAPPVPVPSAPPTVRATLLADPPDARLWLDGRPLQGNPAAADLERGSEHVLSAVAPGREAGQTSFRATDRAHVRLALRPVAAAAPPAAIAAPQQPGSARQGRRPAGVARRARSEVIRKNPYR